MAALQRARNALADAATAFDAPSGRLIAPVEVEARAPNSSVRQPRRYVEEMAAGQVQEQLPDGLRERGKQKRRQQILDAARQLLRQSPDQALTVERIATRADVSQPTVFNLVGRRDEIWAALADQSLEQLDFGDLKAIPDPKKRAQQIVASIIGMVCADPLVFRALLQNWSQSARVLHHDPTDALARCFAESGVAASRVTAELTIACVIGVLHQWSAELISDEQALRRGHDMVELAFRAGSS